MTSLLWRETYDCYSFAPKSARIGRVAQVSFACGGRVGRLHRCFDTLAAAQYPPAGGVARDQADVICKAIDDG